MLDSGSQRSALQLSLAWDLRSSFGCIWKSNADKVLDLKFSICPHWSIYTDFAQVAIYSLDMSYPDPSGGYPPPPREQPESQYPPPPGEEDDRARAYHQRAPSGNVTLPSISPYDPQYTQPNGYSPDPRAYQQDPYRAPPGPYRDDRGGYQQDYGRGGQQHMAFSQSAPRQRTAIACRYCRRRKVSRSNPILIA